MRRGDDGSLGGSEPDDAIDLAALRADDQFIESLVRGRVQSPTRRDDVDAELVAMLTAWVQDVRPETLVDTEPEAEEPEMAPPAPRLLTKRPRHGRSLAVAASMVMLASSGLALGAYDARPGETLWPVAKVFYAERAKSVEAATDVAIELEHARTALRQGHTDEAAQAVAAARAKLPDVRPDEGRATLVDEQEQLTTMLTSPPAEAPSAPSSPSSGSRPAPNTGSGSPETPDAGTAAAQADADTAAPEGSGNSKPPSAGPESSSAPESHPPAAGGTTETPSKPPPSNPPPGEQQPAGQTPGSTGGVSGQSAEEPKPTSGGSQTGGKGGSKGQTDGTASGNGTSGKPRSGTDEPKPTSASDDSGSGTPSTSSSDDEGGTGSADESSDGGTSSDSGDKAGDESSDSKKDSKKDSDKSSDKSSDSAGSSDKKGSGHHGSLLSPVTDAVTDTVDSVLGS